jgi:beta-glucosidase
MNVPRSIAVPLLLLGTGIAVKAQQPPTAQQAQVFVTRLLASMSVEEKIGQMEQVAGQTILTDEEATSLNQAAGKMSVEQANDMVRKGKVGSFLFITDPERINALQRVAVTESPHHIPLIFGYDVIHGFRTESPIPLALASSWDPALVEHALAMAAREARAAGIDWAFTPMVDIARDPRWGRIMEGAGEDPYLGEVMAAAQVRGLQGAEIGAPNHILACVKHFAGYGAAEGGRDYDSVDLSDDQLHNVYLRPYKAALDAGAATFMSAYMDLNGVPATGNNWLMQDVLRKQWGFQGFVVSDWEAVLNLTTHGFASGPEDAAQRAFHAGINMEMTSSLYNEYLPALVKSGKITSAQLDAIVRPILEMKYRLGLFTNPYASMDAYKDETLSPAQRESSRLAAEQSSVLLRNEQHLLPLAPSIKSIALIGPLADSGRDTIGSWSLHANPADTVTLAAGLRAKLPNVQINVTKGVEIVRTDSSIFDEQAPEPPLTLLTPAAREAEFAHAIDLVRQSDIAILVLGEAQNMNGERASRATLNLPGQQEELLEAAVATGKPVVLVLMTGRPLDISWAAQHVPAILNIWYPGTEGGNAVANLLTGAANPSGHLTVTWPRSVGQIPLFYASNLTQIPDARATRYWDEPSSPLYPFGFGLSYTSFSIDGLKAPAELTKTGKLYATVTVRNTGSVAGDQVVQAYTHQRAGSASRPVRELKAFTKVHLAPGESKSVTLIIPAASLGYWSPASHTDVLEPGTFDLWVGDSAVGGQHAVFELVPYEL